MENSKVNEYHHYWKLVSRMCIVRTRIYTSILGLRLSLAATVIALILLPTCGVCLKNEDIRWSVMDVSDYNYTGSPVYNGSTYDSVYVLMKSIGVEAMNTTVSWRSSEQSSGVYSWGKVDFSASRARESGLLWVPQIAVHYRPWWLCGTKGNTKPYDWIYSDGTTDSDRSLWSPPNFFFQGDTTHKSSAYYVQRFINEFGKRYGVEKPPVVMVSDGTYGEAYYPQGGTDPNPVRDPYTIAAWNQDKPSTAMYTSPDTLCSGTADQQAFGRWWYGRLISDYVAQVHNWLRTAFPDSSQGMKYSTNSTMCQNIGDQIAAAEPYGLEVCSFGGPVRFSSPMFTSIPHGMGNLAWIESSIDDLDTVGLNLDILNNHYLDALNFSIIFTLFGYPSDYPSSQPTSLLKGYANLINASKGVLVSNGSFESGTSGWHLGSWATGISSWGTTTDTAVVGAQSLYATTNSVGLGSVESNSIGVAPNTEYVVGAFIKGSSTHRCGLTIKEYDSDNHLIIEHGPPAVFAADWQYVYARFTTTSQTSKVGVCLWTYGANKTSYCDYVTLRGSAITNPDFESGTTGWSVIDPGAGWGVTGGQSHTGARSAYITASDGVAALISDSISVNGTRHQYWLSCYAKATVSERVNLYVREYDVSGNLLKEHGTVRSVGNEWKLVRHVFTPDPRTATYKISLYYYGSSGTAYFDTIRVQDSPIWNPGFENASLGLPDGWTATSGSSAAWGQTNNFDGSPAIADAVFTEGTHALYVDGGGGVTTTVPIAPENRYQIGCFTMGQDVIFRVRERTSDSSIICDHEARAASQGKFKYVECSFAATPSTESISIELLNMSAARAYFDDVRIDMSDGAATAPQFSSISEARNAANGVSIALDGVLVTAKFYGASGQISFAVENADRSAGIRIVSTAAVEPGNNVTVQGLTSTVNGERFIDASGGSVSINSTGNIPPAPLGMRTAHSGGGDLGAQGGVLNQVSTGEMAVGLNNTGLFVRLFGKVTAVVNNGWNGYFYIDDGSGLNDGSGNIGLKCRVPGSSTTPGTLPALGKFVIVAGVMGVQQINGINTRYLWTAGYGVVPQ